MLRQKQVRWRMTIKVRRKLNTERSLGVAKVIWMLCLLLLLAACRDQETSAAHSAAAAPEKATAVSGGRQALPTPTIRAASQPEQLAATPTIHLEATAVHLPTPFITRSAATVLLGQDVVALVDPILEGLKATAVPPVDCDDRFPDGELLTIVTQEYGISSEFAPDDLVPLADHLPYTVTVGYPTEVRQVMLQPLLKMIGDMTAAGLQPQILSGYRSYTAQAISWNKWNNLYPDHAAIISARPGHSEHQLGTVIDFGSPELPGLVGQPGIQFHTRFSETSEGRWLAENAHSYGFTLSFTLEAFAETGFYYEPWHYRYVGQAMAAQLREQEQTLTEYQLANEAAPCLP